jgi:hypothetical protein
MFRKENQTETNATKPIFTTTPATISANTSPEALERRAPGYNMSLY